MNVVAARMGPRFGREPYCARMAHARGILRALTGTKRRRGAPGDDRFREQVVEGMVRSLSPRPRREAAGRAGEPPAAEPIGARGVDRRR